jgi:uncharacterized protein
METITAFIKRRPVLSYFVLTFAISWSGLLVIGGTGETASGTTWQSDPRLAIMIVAMLAGPSIAGLLLTGFVAGKAGFRELFSRLFRWHVGASWYAVALLTAPLVYTAVHSVLALTSSVYLPTIVTTRDKMSMLLVSVVAGLGVGLFEELGWTGFAIPRLRLRYSVLATGLLVGVPWGAWHLLTNDLWIGDTYAGSLPLPFFYILTGLSLLVGQLLAYRVLMVWVYDRTGSLLVAILMHASLVVCTFAAGASATGSAYLIYVFTLGAAWWVVVAAVAVINHGHFTRPSLPRPVT